ncbi:MAG: MBL fold metallo-hydrolase [Actinomycetota bacterium]
MRVRIWGSRGSLATPGPDTLRFGGNTSCAEVRLEDGTLIVLDAGTGIRPLGLELEREPEPVRAVHLLLTHLHLDHLEGLGFFGPMWRAEVDLHVWGPPSPLLELERRVEKLLSPPLFPVRLLEVPSRLMFHDVTREPWNIGTATVHGQEVVHQGPTVAYRIEENGSSLAYIPDHEPALGRDLGRIDTPYLSGYGVAQGVDVLIHDSQYTEDEYPKRIGWGHSSTAHVVGYAQRTGVKQLVMFHHDPLHGDAFLESNLERARDLWDDHGPAPVLAYEGMEIELD